MMRFDTLWAFLHKYALKQLARSNGVSSKQIKTIFKDAHLISIVEGIYEPVKTSSLRKIGMRLDDAQIRSLPPLETHDIQVPTYIGHAINDPLAPVTDAKKLASLIPNATYNEVSDGGHIFFVVHHETVIPDIEQFLLQNCGYDQNET
jgi:pimeloyl-ACP methyl ester carboxylesterase